MRKQCAFIVLTVLLMEVVNNFRHSANGKDVYFLLYKKNKLIFRLLECINRPRGLVHRCRLGTSWSCRSGQGLGCSSIKVPHELGSVRRETVR